MIGTQVALAAVVTRKIIATLIALSIAGCVPRTKVGSAATLLGGAAMAVVGGVLLADLKSPGNDTNGNGVDDFPENDIACALGGCAAAIGMLAAGVGMAIVGGIGLADSGEKDEVPIILTPPPDAAPGTLPSRLDTRLVTPLPEVPCDRMTLQLAVQARTAARRGDCAVARTMVEHVRERDAVYGIALAESSALGRCRRPRR